MDSKTIIEHLKSLAEAGRAFWEGGAMIDGGSVEDHFETELVRAEDFLEEVKRNADL